MVAALPSLYDPILDLDIFELDKIETVTLHTCQICFDDCRSNEVATRICGSGCPACVCFNCISEFVRVRTQSVPAGVLAKLNCPIYIRPVNLMRWKERCAPISHVIENFNHRVASACSILCPGCHRVTNMLPLPATSAEPIKMKTSLTKKLPQLRQRCQQFCQHELSLNDLCQFVQANFPDHYTDVMHRILPLIHGVERRASLFLRLTRDQPFIKTPCCTASICFTCKTYGHHERTPCSAMFVKKEAVAHCPGCNLTLAKGDGCNWVTCFCGYGFDWTLASMIYQWSQLTARQVQVVKQCVASYIQLRRLRKKVLPALVRYVRVQEHKPQLLVVCEFLRHQRLRTRFRRNVLPQMMARVIMMDIAKQKKYMLVVCNYLLGRAKRVIYSKRLARELLIAVVRRTLAARPHQKPAWLKVSKFLRDKRAARRRPPPTDWFGADY